jgi:hypothetical protein
METESLALQQQLGYPASLLFLARIRWLFLQGGDCPHPVNLPYPRLPYNYPQDVTICQMKA